MTSLASILPDLADGYHYRATVARILRRIRDRGIEPRVVDVVACLRATLSDDAEVQRALDADGRWTSALRAGRA